MAKSESTKIEFGYFHDYESEQFAFYRIKAYLLTCLMNSITTIGNYYQAKVNHDMYGGGI